jgi:hypothetical protein
MAGFAGNVGGTKSGRLHQQLHPLRHLRLQDLLQTLCGQRVGVGVDQQKTAWCCGVHGSYSFSVHVISKMLDGMLVGGDMPEVRMQVVKGR